MSEVILVLFAAFVLAATQSLAPALPLSYDDSLVAQEHNGLMIETET